MAVAVGCEVQARPEGLDALVEKIAVHGQGRSVRDAGDASQQQRLAVIAGQVGGSYPGSECPSGDPWGTPNLGVFDDLTARILARMSLGHGLLVGCGGGGGLSPGAAMARDHESTLMGRALRPARRRGLGREGQGAQAFPVGRRSGRRGQGDARRKRHRACGHRQGLATDPLRLARHRRDQQGQLRPAVRASAGLLPVAGIGREAGRPAHPCEERERCLPLRALGAGGTRRRRRSGAVLGLP